MKINKKIWDYLFHPFRFIAGVKALILGILVMILLVGLCYLTDTELNGAFDNHLGCQKSTFINQIYYVFGVYIIMIIVFYITAILAGGKKVRFIDIAGTFALAKIPLIFAILCLFPMSKAFCGIIDLANPTSLSPENMRQIMILSLKMSPLLIVGMAMIIWYIVLLYNGYSVSANVRSTKGVLTFIAAAFVCEILSKIFLAIVI